MRCPDCGSRLTELRISGPDFCYRCGRCGGFWIDSWTVNRITDKNLSSWRRISIDQMWLRGGKGLCPLDGIILKRYIGEGVPQQMEVLRCVRCGKWWFPRDSMYEYKQAAEAKGNYYRLWGLKGDMESLALPILGLIVLLMGLFTGVRLILEHPEILTRAMEALGR